MVDAFGGRLGHGASAMQLSTALAPRCGRFIMPSIAIRLSPYVYRTFAGILIAAFNWGSAF